jgi:formylglycine-generating enzyme required for sulfatase activity
MCWAVWFARPRPPVTRRSACAAAWVLLGIAQLAWADRGGCPPDAVPVGPVCIDRYEASVWSIPGDSARVVGRIRKGKITLGDLAAAGATQMGPIPMTGCTGFDYGAAFAPTGNWTAPLYAVSVAGVPPSTCVTWFQAEQACRLAGKRLLTNEEWQAAAAGTPDPGDADDGTTTCATNSDFAALTGARSACVSLWGAHDMAGNVWEWTATWINPVAACTFWDAAHGGDLSCIGFGSTTSEPSALTGRSSAIPRELVSFDPSLPGALIRGGNYATGTRNGIFAIFAGVNPSNISRSTGFRCAR